MGPDIRPSPDPVAASLYDVTPTVLHLLGLPVGADMAGSVLPRALETGAAPRTIETYDVLREYRPGATSPFEDRIRKELEALGYVQ